MSAFQVAPAHIGAIVRWYLLDCPDHLRTSWRSMRPNANDADSMMSALAFENWQSVKYRYEDRLDADELPVLCDDTLRLYKKLTPVQVIKAVDCLEYQSCEHPTWEETDACKLLQAIKGAAISRLPGYEDAEWAIDEMAGVR